MSLTGTAAATATLTVVTTAPTTSAITPAVRSWSRWYPLGETALAGLLIFGFRARRRNWRLFAGMLLLLAAFTGGITACGGGGGGSSSVPAPTSTPGTTLGNYIVTVTGTSGGISATASLNLVVQ